MCGIAGALTPGRSADECTLRRMAAAMSHRGPDGEYVWTGDGIGLAVRRLAIVDVAGGAQPLCNERQSVRVVFNGEIYNHEQLRRELTGRGHRLASRTDGEVIPHLYEEHGARLFERLDGIFAIALWDTDTSTLLLARDPLGVKPLYVWRRGAELRFASEIKALLEDRAVPRELDLAALDDHLTYRFTPSPRTLLAGVEKLRPGTVLGWRDGRSSVESYRRGAPPPPSSLSFEDAAAVLRDRLGVAVGRQLMSDRPIGAMLSGGVDSAAVVAMMAQRSPTVKTFTVGFEGGGDADETAPARATAALFGTDHHELVIGRSDFAAELPRVIEMLEEPVATSSAVGFLAVARLASERVPVLLSGQGADELLAGYWRYVGEWLAGAASPLARPVAGGIGWLAELARSARLERGLRALAQPDPLARFMSGYAVFTESQKRELYSAELAAELGGRDSAPPVERLLAEAAGLSPLEQMLYVDLRLWLPDDLLLVGDKMTMAASVEMRVPFLDPAVVDFVESLPGSYKLRRGRRKAIEKAALAPLLPASILDRPERGFVTPVERWLRGEMHGFARETLLGADSWCAGLFRRTTIERLLDRHASRRFDHTRQIFCLLSFELWARRFLAPSLS